MLLSKLSIAFVLLISLNIFASEELIDLKTCLDTPVSTDVKHKGNFWGLVKHKIDINKEKCVIRIKHKKMFTNSWEIDVCRGPVHIKIVKSGIEVIKRDGTCKEESKPNAPRSEFCQEFDKVSQAIQDDGLIFASGEKEDVDTAHGKIYCVFALIKKYLQDGVVMSRQENFDWEAIKDKVFKLESCKLEQPAPEEKEEAAEKKEEKEDEKEKEIKAKNKSEEKTSSKKDGDIPKKLF